MRRMMVGVAVAAMMAGPAFADTLEHVIAKGIVFEVEGGIEIPVSYAEDGTYVADVFGEQFPGVWRIKDGNVLCTKGEAEPAETCVEYPADKAPGDVFELTTDQGAAIIHINE